MTDYKLTIEDLSNAIKNDEFLFFYQPILSLETGKIVSAEALIRWKKDNGELVQPDNFIPYAEQTGFITEITKAMIPRFLEDLKKIHQENNTIVLAINISSKDMIQKEFVPDFLKLVKDSGVEYSKIKIELTESSALALSTECLMDIAELKANGIKLAIDDFGTGHATFEKLKKLPFDTLKIDQTMTSEAMSTPDGLTLLDHSINLAHQLKMNSIAEGVETDTLMKYLMGLGCDHIQGYYISKPLELSSFIEFINKKRVWDIMKHGQIYKTMIDFIDWERKVYSCLYMEGGNARIVAFEPEDSPTGKFLSEVSESVEIELYNELDTSYKKSYEIAKILLNAKSSGDSDLIKKLLPDYFKACAKVSTLLQKAYSKECQNGLLKNTSFRK
ncbi:EAL domain-containing protein [Thiomicrorhabdus sp.]|uniref:EAL domain-containing protein n=1 Tax=Thiomicrorhabdus sp. TaxID=2039724 RepID=UPI002AA7E55C|nr:EAL domain-containing protein [Thiomicrorhabdus sp.]